MFLQVFQGRVRHSEPVYVELDAWIKEIAPGTEGWLGSTAGVTDDNRFIGIARWQSSAAARHHGERPEQKHWWSAFAELFEDPPTLRESSEVLLDVRAEPDQARFVQVMQGRATDLDQARRLFGSHGGEWASFRPEILGTVGCLFDDGGYTVATYFTDEASAREGEHRTPPAELQQQMDDISSLAVGLPEYFDLREPWVHSPANSR